MAPQEGRCDETPQKAFSRSIIALFVFGTGTLVPKCPVTPTFQPSKEGNNAGAQRSGKFLQCPFALLSAKFERLDDLESRFQADLDDICETFNVERRSIKFEKW